MWLQHGGIPVASAKHLLRPASTPELLACQVRARAMTPVLAPPSASPAEQSSYLDARGQQASSPAGPDAEGQTALSASDDEEGPDQPARPAGEPDRAPSAVVPGLATSALDVQTHSVETRIFKRLGASVAKDHPML